MGFPKWFGVTNFTTKMMIPRNQKCVFIKMWKLYPQGKLSTHDGPDWRSSRSVIEHLLDKTALKNIYHDKKDQYNKMKTKLRKWWDQWTRMMHTTSSIFKGYNTTLFNILKFHSRRNQILVASWFYWLHWVEILKELDWIERSKFRD